MNYILYGIANCDKIRQTRRSLDAAGIPYRFHDYRKQGIDEALVRELLQAFSASDLINRRGTTWRSLPSSTRESLEAGDSASLIAALTEQPAMIKRPILCHVADTTTDGATGENRTWRIGGDCDVSLLR